LIVRSTVLFLYLLIVSGSAHAEGAMGGAWLLVMMAIPVVIVAVPIWLGVRWFRSGRSDSHARFKNKEAETPPLGRLGE
jgi:flagellar basal body-associated protein FliL